MSFLERTPTPMRLSLLCAITFIHHNIPSTATSCGLLHASTLNYVHAPDSSSCPITLRPTAETIWYSRLVQLRLDVLAQPSDTLSVTLPHDHTAHEDLYGPDTLKRDLALSGGLVQSKSRAELILGDSIGVVNLVAEDDERCVLELVHGEQGVEFGLGFGETLVVLCIDEEDDTADFGDCGNC
jgi:hypothetical protein